MWATNRTYVSHVQRLLQERRPERESHTHGLIVDGVRQPREGGADFWAWAGALCASAWAGTKILEVSSLNVFPAFCWQLKLDNTQTI